MNKKNNQRYHDMDICMKAALLELMKKTAFEKITVKSICERAGVNRGTFYSHYTDIYAMIEDAENYLNEELISITEQWSRNYPSNQKQVLLIKYLSYIKEHRYFYRISLANRKNLSVKKTFRPLWEEYVLPQCQQSEIIEKDTLLYYFIAFEGSITMVLQHWIETDCRDSEEMVSAILQNCMPTIGAIKVE